MRPVLPVGERYELSYPVKYILNNDVMQCDWCLTNRALYS